MPRLLASRMNDARHLRLAVDAELVELRPDRGVGGRDGPPVSRPVIWPSTTSTPGELAVSPSRSNAAWLTRGPVNPLPATHIGFLGATAVSSSNVNGRGSSNWLMFQPPAFVQIQRPSSSSATLSRYCCERRARERREVEADALVPAVVALAHPVDVAVDQARQHAPPLRSITRVFCSASRGCPRWSRSGRRRRRGSRSPRPPCWRVHRADLAVEEDQVRTRTCVDLGARREITAFASTAVEVTAATVPATTVPARQSRREFPRMRSPLPEHCKRLQCLTL